MGAEICVIMNAGSGKQKTTERRSALEAAFADYPNRFVLRTVQKGSELEAAARKAIEDGFAIIVAAGGDGTVAAIAGCVAGSGRRMGVIPFGTFNYFARSLRIPEETGESVRVLAEGETCTMDAGEVNGRVFVNNASLGAYPVILQHRERIYRRWGRSRIMAYISALVTLLRFKRPLQVTVRVDTTTRRLRTPLVFVAKNAGQLEEVGLEGADCVRSGKFAVFIARETSRLGLLVFAIRLAFGWSEPHEDFDLLCGREVVIETRMRRRLVALDGERDRMVSPFRFRLRHGQLTVVIPRGTVP